MPAEEGWERERSTTEIPKATRKSLRSRSQEVRYTFTDAGEGEPDDMDLPDEVQGYICVSADPRRSGGKLYYHQG